VPSPSGGTVALYKGTIMQLPPLHPILVNFTAAFVPASIVTDGLGRLLRRSSLTVSAWWMLVYAALITPFTAAAGWFWMRSFGDMDHWQMGIHKWLGTGMVFVLIMLAGWRWRYYRRTESPSRAYLIFAGVVVAALVVQADLGGSMSFGAANSEPPKSQATDAAPEHRGETATWHDHINVKD
jgi:uncharacterized membrane protein